MAYNRIKCPKCDLDFGQEVRFLEHLTESHGISNYRQFYVELYHAGIDPKCACSADCDVLVKWSCWKKGFTSKYARGHNARVDSVWNDSDRQKQFAEKRKEGFESGRIRVWNDGLTKETDDRIAIAAEKASITINEGYSTGRIVDWRLTDPTKAAAAAEKISSTKKRMHESGELVAWNKGKTKDDCPSIAAAGIKISQRYKEVDAGNRIKLSDVIRRIDGFVDKFTLVSDINDYAKRRVNRLLFKCVVCGTVQGKSLAMLEETPVCYHCHPRESKGQLELYEFVKSLATDAILSAKGLIQGRLELDVYVPSAKLAIEYDGLWWHGPERQDDKHKSQKKMDACREAGIKFMVVYEDEWQEKRDIIQNMIKHRLGVKSSKVLDARKLHIAKITPKQAKDFFEANHLDGYVASTVSYGLLEDDGTIVAASALRRPFHVSLGNVLEVSRSAVARNIVVRGWLGRLTKVLCSYAREQGKTSLVTYVDNRVGTGAGYQAAGWKILKADTGPRFWWTDYIHRWDRFRYKADKINGLTQQQVADAAGVVPIFGCSNSLWQFQI